MDLFGKNHADAIAGAQHWGQGYACFFPLSKLQILATTQNYGYLSITSLFYLYICTPLYFMVSYLFPAIFSHKLPLSEQHCLLISIPTCYKLTSLTWRLNLTVLARINLLIIFERCLQEVKSFHLFQYEMRNTASCVFKHIVAFTIYHRNMKKIYVCIKIKARVKIKLELERDLLSTGDSIWHLYIRIP